MTAASSTVDARPAADVAASKRLVLLASILGSSAVFLDGTLVNVALPAIRAGLHAGLAAQQWILDAYLLTLGALMLVGGSLGDLLGRRFIFEVGVAGFGLFSLLCAAAPTVGLLCAARALQGAAGALLVPGTLALIMETFQQEERSAAIGSWTAWTGIATVVGPLIGGSLVQAASWRWIFVINLPLVLLTLGLIRATPSSSRRGHGSLDWVGAALCVVGLGGPIFALIEQPSGGWVRPLVLAPMAVGFAALVCFARWERRSPDPMLPLGLFRSRNFLVGNIATLMLYGALSASSFVLVVFLQQVAGYSALAAGASTMPMTLLLFFLSKHFGALSDRVGPRVFIGVGPLLAGAGLLLLSRLGARAIYLPDVLPGVLVFGLGMAVTVAPLTAAVLGGADAQHAGVASGVNNAVSRVAGLVAIAAVGAAVAAQFSSTLDNRFTGRALPAAAEHAVVHAKARPLVLDVSAFPRSFRPAAHRALTRASVTAARLGLAASAILALLAGIISLAEIRNPARQVPAAACRGGPLFGASRDPALTTGEQ
jgi:EmrB/QacA subfamily drug resistance transporter